jgi:hypothetical protein
MSIVSGLVDTGSERSVAPQRTVAGEWAMRNAWGLILTGSVIFWLTLAYLVVWR